MDQYEDLFSDIINNQKILKHFEELCNALQNLDDIKLLYLKAFENYKLKDYHKIILGVVFLESLSENLKKLGVFLIDENFKDMSNDRVEQFFKYVDSLDPKFKNHLFSIVSLKSQLKDLNENFYDQIVHILNESLETPAELTDIIMSPVDEKSDPQRSETSPGSLLEAIKMAHKISEYVIDYNAILAKNTHLVSPSSIIQASLYLSKMERHPVVQTFNFILAVHNFDESYFECFIDTLFEFQQDLDFDSLNTIFGGYYKVYRSHFLITDIYKYKNIPSFIIIFVEIAVFSPEYMSFTNMNHHSVDVTVVYPEPADNLLPETWSSLEFISLLLSLYDAIPDRIIRTIRHGIINHPDILLLGLLQQPNISITGNVKKIVHELLAYYIKTERSSLSILKYIWGKSEFKDVFRPLLLQCLQEYFSQNFSDISVRLDRILDVTHSLDAVHNILRTSSIAFVIEYAIAASKRNYIQLHFWLQGKLVNYNEQFVTALYSYLVKHFSALFFQDQQQLSNESQKLQRSLSILDELIPFIYQYRHLLSSEHALRVQSVYINYYFVSKYAPRPQAEFTDEKFKNTAEVVAILLNSIENFTSSEAKCHEIDKFFRQRVLPYTQQTHSFTLFYINKVLINNQIYRLLKDTDLHSAASIFTRLLHFTFIKPAQVAEFVDDLFNDNPVKSRFFYYGITILASCFTILNSSQALCTRWFNSVFFNDLPPFLRFCVEYGHHLGTIPLEDSGSFAFNDPTIPLAKHHDYITLMTQSHTNVVEKVYYTSEILSFNKFLKHPELLTPKTPDLSQQMVEFLDNLTLEDLEKPLPSILLDSDNYEWLSWHIVMNIIPFRVEEFPLYKNLLILLNNRVLYIKIRGLTDTYIKHILYEYKYAKHPKERQMLYNLGLWFGFITLADGHPPNFNEINVKHLLIECNFKGQDDIGLVLPFIKNYLFYCRKHFIFKKTNPYIYEILRVMKEIYDRCDIRLEIKFEIEVIFRSFDANVRSVNPTSYSQMPEILEKVNTYLPWSERRKSVKLFKLTISKTEMLAYDHIQWLSNFEKKLILDGCPKEMRSWIITSLKKFSADISHWLLNKISNSISNIVSSIVSEDFKKDPSESRLKYSSHTLGKSVCLSHGSIILKCTHFLQVCKRLNQCLTNTFMEQYKLIKSTPEKEHIEEIIYLIAQSNIEFIIAYILILSTEGIVIHIENKLKKEYEIRRKFKYEKRDFNNRTRVVCVKKILDKHRIKQNNIATPQQISLYSEINKYIPGFNASNQGLERDYIMNETINLSFLRYTNVAEERHLLLILQNSYLNIYRFISENSAIDKFESVYTLLNIFTYIFHRRQYTIIPLLVKQTLSCYFYYLSVTFPTNDSVVDRLIDHLINILVKLKEYPRMDKKLTGLITLFVLTLSPDKRYNVQAIFTLVVNRLIDLRRFDKHLVREFYDIRSPLSFNFCMDFCKCLLADENHRTLATEYNLTNSLNALNKIITSNNIFENSSMFNDDHYGKERLDNKIKAGKVITSENALRQWVKIYFLKSDQDMITAFKVFSLRLAEFGYLQNEDALIDFIKSLIVIVLTPHATPGHSLDILRTYQIIDSLLQFIILMVKFRGGPKEAIHPIKIRFYTRILQVLHQLILNQTEVKFPHFQSHIYERIISGFVAEIVRPDIHDMGLNDKLILCLNGFLHSISPYEVPLFTESFLAIVSNSNLWLYCLRNGPCTKSASLYSMLLCDLIRYTSYTFELSTRSHIVAINMEKLTHLLADLAKCYPSFISYYYISFINVINPKCFQLRNLILSAIPENSPHDFDPELYNKFEVPEVYLFIYKYVPPSLIKMTDIYFQQKIPENFVSSALSYFEDENSFKHGSVAIGLINTYVYHLGTLGTREISLKNQFLSMNTVKSTITYAILLQFAESLSLVSRYFFLTSIANHIRYLTPHTLFFIYTIQSIFLNTTKEEIKDHILRVLIERVICNGPYPLGIVYILNNFFKESSYYYQLISNRILNNPTTKSIIEKAKNNAALIKTCKK